MKKSSYILGVLISVVVIGCALHLYLITKSTQCSYPDCNRQSVAGSKFCAEHDTTYAESKDISIDNQGSLASSEEKSDLCFISGCTRKVKSGSRFCMEHTCHKPGCNLRVTDTANGSQYCSSHTCLATDCYNMITNGYYCSTHAYKNHNELNNYSGSSGKIGTSSSKNSSSKSSSSKSSSSKSSSSKNSSSKKSSNTKKSDPYDVYDYDDPEDFYYDYFDDFDGYEDAEDYFDDAWDEWD